MTRYSTTHDMLNDTAPILPEGTLPIRGELDIDWNGHGWAHLEQPMRCPCCDDLVKGASVRSEPNGDELVVCACLHVLGRLEQV